MDFFLRKGVNFKEHFDFKNEKQKAIPTPSGEYKIVLERGAFARVYTVGDGLLRLRTSIEWTISGKESENFEFTTMYYTLYLNDVEVTRGVLKVQ